MMGKAKDKVPGLYLLAARDIMASLKNFPEVYLAISFYEIYGVKLLDLLNACLAPNSVQVWVGLRHLAIRHSLVVDWVVAPLAHISWWGFWWSSCCRDGQDCYLLHKPA